MRVWVPLRGSARALAVKLPMRWGTWWYAPDSNGGVTNSARTPGEGSAERNETLGRFVMRNFSG
ncbi:hypothetical protein GCM10012280_54170 [Wenjunlia tyrosinilytica]|uniref:Uncharacterized protein n=1 Tax=Wenjunlia tyrosinilytica TaxID=1544741 RepID=A0A918E1E6_9ACTN|nr:hypothetical protein GCM10012280_54170 [Wenjunlia tyrosinilytica]